MNKPKKRRLYIRLFYLVLSYICTLLSIILIVLGAPFLFIAHAFFALADIFDEEPFDNLNPHKRWKNIKNNIGNNEFKK